jgi:hypothetical protein
VAVETSIDRNRVQDLRRLRSGAEIIPSANGGYREGVEAAAAGTDFSNTKKASGAMKKAVKLLDGMYAEYEKNLAESGRSNAMPRVAVKDWREACLDKKIYKKRSNFNRALESMVDRDLVHLDENKVHVCSVSIYLKFQEKGIDF